MCWKKVRRGILLAETSILKPLKNGLTAFQLKWIALFFMTLDHLAAFGFEIPLIARYTTLLRKLGRIAAPLFLFVLVQGVRHTRSKPRFLFRLYFAGMGTELFVTATNFFLGEAVVYQTPGNVIFTFFYVVLYIVILEELASSVRDRWGRATLMAVLAIAVWFVPQILRETLWQMIPANASLQQRFLQMNLIDSFIPSVYSVDYGCGLILLGVVMYFARTKQRQAAVFAGFCLLCMGVVCAIAIYPRLSVVYLHSSFANIFFSRSQCLMVMALPFMMLYNEQRGTGSKWFFYAYYPLHRYLITLTASVFF